MVISPFDRLRSARAQIVEKCRYSTAKPIIAQNTNLVAEKIAVPRTRGSVRRASGFVQIVIALITSDPSCSSRTQASSPAVRGEAPREPQEPRLSPHPRAPRLQPGDAKARARKRDRSRRHPPSAEKPASA